MVAFNVALGEKEGSVTMNYMPWDNWGRRRNNLGAIGVVEGGDGETVPMKRFDDIFDFSDEIVGLIKMVPTTTLFKFVFLQCLRGSVHGDFFFSGIFSANFCNMVNLFTCRCPNRSGQVAPNRVKVALKLLTSPEGGQRFLNIF